MRKRDRSELLRELKAAFPPITAQLNHQRGLLYFEVEVFRRHAQRAIFDGDRELADRCFRLAVTFFREGNAAVRRAMDTGFVEPMAFGSPSHAHAWAWELFPAELKRAYVQFHGKSGIPE